MRFSIFKSKLSFPAMAFSLVCFATANVITYMNLDWDYAFSPTYNGTPAHCGFPFAFYYYRTIGGTGEYFWSGIVADVIVAAVTSVVAGINWPLYKQRKLNTAQLNTAQPNAAQPNAAQMPVWLKSLQGGIIGAVVGGLLAIAGVLLFDSLRQPSVHPYDENAVSAQLVIAVFTVLAGAVIGFIIGLVAGSKQHKD